MKLLQPTNFTFASLGTILALLADIPVSIQALTMLVILDMLTGWGKAYVTRQLSSDISRKGAIRKGMSFLLVAAGWVANHQLHVPVAMHEIIATFFCFSELLSIVENCQQAGLNIPSSIIQRFKVYAEEDNHARSDRQ